MHRCARYDATDSGAKFTEDYGARGFQLSGVRFQKDPLADVSEVCRGCNGCECVIWGPREGRACVCGL